MTRSINPAFQEALQQLGRSTTPDDLRERGITRLRSIKSSQIALLIERAVNRTLMERTIGPLDAVELEQILHEAENQFTRQLADFEELADTKSELEAHRRDMQSGIERLRSACAEPRTTGTTAERAARAGELRQKLFLEVATALAPLLPAGYLDEVGRGVTERLCELVERRLAAAADEQRRRFEIELDIQERRVVKLMDWLERTEQVLERVAAAKDLEHGIESIYRSVQGLAPGEQNYEIKKRMLARLFETNATGNGAGSSPPRDATAS